MKTIMAKSPHDSNSFSFSRRYFKKKFLDDDNEVDQEEEHILTLHHSYSSQERLNKTHSVSKLKSALSLPLFTTSKTRTSLGGSRVVGTLFGNRRGRVHIAFQDDPKSHPPFLIELPTPTSVLVREMASGLVRIALECDKSKNKSKSKKTKLVEEAIWRSYRNGRKCGYANKVECGSEEWKILKAVGPISMGAGVIPGNGTDEEEGEVMYMRAKFERVVASKDSEAYYLINPDGGGGPELSVFLLRV